MKPGDHLRDHHYPVIHDSETTNQIQDDKSESDCQGQQEERLFYIGKFFHHWASNLEPPTNPSKDTGSKSHSMLTPKGYLVTLLSHIFPFYIII